MSRIVRMTWLSSRPSVLDVCSYVLSGIENETVVELEHRHTVHMV